MRISKYIPLFLAIVVVGCIEVPIEPIENNLDSVNGRARIEQSDLRDCLHQCGVSSYMRRSMNFDRNNYKSYTLSEVQKILNSHQWICA